MVQRKNETSVINKYNGKPAASARHASYHILLPKPITQQWCWQIIHSFQTYQRLICTCNSHHKSRAGLNRAMDTKIPSSERAHSLYWFLHGLQNVILMMRLFNYQDWSSEIVQNPGVSQTEYKSVFSPAWLIQWFPKPRNKDHWRCSQPHGQSAAQKKDQHLLPAHTPWRYSTVFDGVSLFQY